MENNLTDLGEQLLLDSLQNAKLVAHTDDLKCTSSSTDFDDALDDIYHSTSAAEMKLKITTRNLKLTPKKVMALIRCLAYHAAYWPHTIERYYSFLDLIDSDPMIRRSVCSTKVIDLFAVELARFIANQKYYHATRFSGGTPGVMMNFAYLQEIFAAILKYKNLSKKERAQNARIQEEVIQRSSDR